MAVNSYYRTFISFDPFSLLVYFDVFFVIGTGRREKDNLN